MAKSKAKNNDTTTNLGFEAKLWQAADAFFRTTGQGPRKDSRHLKGCLLLCS
jgi:hypothetical protein